MIEIAVNGSVRKHANAGRFAIIRRGAILNERADRIQPGDLAISTMGYETMREAAADGLVMELFPVKSVRRCE